LAQVNVAFDSCVWSQLLAAMPSKRAFISCAWDERIEKLRAYNGAELKTTHNQAARKASSTQHSGQRPKVEMTNYVPLNTKSWQLKRRGPWSEGRFECSDGRAPFITKYTQSEWALYFYLCEVMENIRAARARGEDRLMRPDLYAKYSLMKEEYAAWKAYRFPNSEIESSYKATGKNNLLMGPKPKASAKARKP